MLAFMDVYFLLELSHVVSCKKHLITFWTKDALFLIQMLSALWEIKRLGMPWYWWTSHLPAWPSPWFYLSYWICHYLQAISQSWCDALLQISSLFLCLVMQHSGQVDLSSLIKTKRQKPEKIADMVNCTEEAPSWSDWISLHVYFFLCLSKSHP